MSRTVAYLPAPGTAADRAYAHLLSLAGAEISGPLLCETARLPQGTLGPSMAPLLARGMVFARRKGGHAKSPLFWSTVDHNAKPTTPATFPSSAFDVKTAAAKMEEGRGIRAPAARELARWQRSDSGGTVEVRVSVPEDSTSTGERDDDKGDGGRPCGVASGGDDDRPAAGRLEGGERDGDGAAEREDGLLRAQPPGTACEGNADELTLGAGARKALRAGRAKYLPFGPINSSTGEASSPANGSQTPDGGTAIPPAKAGQDTREGDEAADVHAGEVAGDCEGGAGDARPCVEPVAEAAQATAVGNEGKAAHAEERAADPATNTTASPVGGPMGAGQPAAAGPLEDVLADAAWDRQPLPGDIGIDLARDGADAMAYLVDAWLGKHPAKPRKPVFALRSDGRLWMMLEDGSEKLLTPEATQMLVDYFASWVKGEAP